MPIKAGFDSLALMSMPREQKWESFLDFATLRTEPYVVKGHPFMWVTSSHHNALVVATEYNPFNGEHYYREPLWSRTGFAGHVGLIGERDHVCAAFLWLKENASSKGSAFGYSPFINPETESGMHPDDEKKEREYNDNERLRDNG